MRNKKKKVITWFLFFSISAVSVRFSVDVRVAGTSTIENERKDFLLKKKFTTKKTHQPLLFLLVFFISVWLIWFGVSDSSLSLELLLLLLLFSFSVVIPLRFCCSCSCNLALTFLYKDKSRSRPFRENKEKKK